MEYKGNRWCFTVNNPGEWRPVWQDAVMSYMVWGLEHAPDTGTIHIQGYVRFGQRKTMNGAKRCINERAHMEKARGNEEQNRTYCLKEGGEHAEHGIFDANQGVKGRRTDLEDIAKKIAEGATMKQIAEQHASDYIRYHQGFRALQTELAVAPPIERQVTVAVLWGPTGTGKTHRIMTNFPSVYTVFPGRDAWGQYSDQETICFEEFDWEKWTIQDMNRYLDKWRCPLDARYHNKFARWQRVFILANSNPLEWWPNATGNLLDAFRRRVRGRCFFINSQEPTLEQIYEQQPSII